MDNQKQKLAGPATYIAAASLFICFVSFLVLMYSINSGVDFSWERPVQQYFQNWNEGNVHLVFKIWTELGSRLAIGLISLALIGWLLWKHKDFVGIAITAILVAGTDKLNVFLKNLVGRDRPAIDPSIDAIGYSFPSGHAMLSIVTFSIVAYFISKYIKAIGGKVLIWLIAVFFIVTIGISRVVLSAHFPSDIVAGYCLGFVCFILAIKVYKIVTPFVKK